MIITKKLTNILLFLVKLPCTQILFLPAMSLSKVIVHIKCLTLR